MRAITDLLRVQLGTTLYPSSSLEAQSRNLKVCVRKHWKGVVRRKCLPVEKLEKCLAVGLRAPDS